MTFTSDKRREVAERTMSRWIDEACTVNVAFQDEEERIRQEVEMIQEVAK